jgi:lipid A ethanolaminephosphotransferase
MKLPEFCSSGECHDEILVAQLREYAAKADKDTLVVMHQMGSHGPAYHLRYPPAFERFTPVCKTNLLDKCTSAQITNTYDNTILYTDHVLSSVIDTLKTYQGRFDTSMIYMSDHGESLGEYGLYLHGAPYVLAPEFQKHIPAVLWLSADMQKERGIDAACVAKEKDAEVSHDNLFHSVLGLLDIRTSLYQPGLDLFARCQTAAAG